MKRLWNYIKNRLEETSTKAGIMTMIVSIAACPHPLDFIGFGIGLFLTLIPTSGGSE